MSRPNSKSAKQQQIVVYQPKPNAKPNNNNNNKNKKKVNNAKLSNPRSDQLLSYKAALSDPFNKMACGARVPDMYSYPTTTYHTEGTVTLQSNALGVASVLITPMPFNSMVDMTTSSVYTTGMTRYAAGSNYAAVTQFQIGSKLSNYRLVGGGVELRNLLPPTTATGRVIAVNVPMSGSGPGIQALENFNVTNYISNAHISGIGQVAGSSSTDGTIGYSSSILSLPGAVEMTIQDLISSALAINFKPVSPRGFDIRNTKNINVIGQTAYADVRQVVGSAATTVADNIGTLEPYGWDCILLKFEGLPASTVCADLKYILHFEGTPALDVTSGGLVADADNVPHVNVLGFYNVLDSVLASPSIKMIGSALASGIAGYASGGIGGAISSIMSKVGFTR